MYAIIKDGGHQYRVQEGDEIVVQRKDVEPGKTFDFKEVLLVGGKDVKVGTPTVSGAAVKATCIGEEKADKIIILRFRRRKASKTKKGHRQKMTRFRIDKITAGGK